ncbi:T9SS type A sorting domain-containing protein [Flavobacterium ajazii]|uniref:T9SS type A sorting domain-containing protein n=1 Tax=Flavobacterium ajazii TaxID=2692318 RepID=UPI0013D8CE73|nr:T9SS type A sorting domain-containing protein [Flavobacterium ajazii]
MRKNYVHLVLLLLLNISMFGQKVTLTPTLVNGLGFSSGSINLGSIPTSTISLSVKVEIPTAAAVGDQGTIKIYFSKGTALGSNITTGGDGGALYFGGGKVATRSFIINLNWSDFLTSGGFIFAEYNNGVTYKSSNITVIKNSTVNTGTNLNPPADAPNPNKIVNTLCCNQTIRLGDKPAPITGSQYLNPYEGLPYGITRRIIINNGNIDNYDDLNKILYLDYTTELKDITINRQLGYVYGNEYPNQSNTVKIKVVPSPILSNNIGPNNATDANSDGFVEFSSLKSIDFIGTASMVDLNILRDPYHVYDRADEISRDATYSWEYAKTNKDNLTLKNWIPIISDNSSNLYGFTPPNSNSEDNYYVVRRIASYGGISRVSNEVKIMTRGMRYNNIICCDQTLNISSLTNFEAPTIINGSTPIMDETNIQGTNFKTNSISYQWQSQTISRGISIWSDISGATSKDYLPPLSSLKVINNGGRTGVATFKFESSYNYRRIAKINYQYYDTKLINKTTSSFSNEISLSGSSSEAYTKIYPNPTSSTLNIQSKDDISNAKLRITNIMGITTNYNFSVINSNLISIDVSQLTAGTYFISIDTRDNFNSTFIKQ